MRYPMVRAAGNYTQTIEPIVALNVSPSIDDEQEDIPNEDSDDIAFDFANLFSKNRFPGIDRLESGTRFTYGLRAGVAGPPGLIDGFLGQSFRFEEDETLPDDSGLEEDFSDWVGGVRVSAPGYLDLDYRFRVAADNFSSQRQELSFVGGPPVFSVGGTYLFAEGIETTDIDDDREQLFLSVTSRFADEWSAGSFHRRDLGDDDRSLETGFFIAYECECFLFTINAKRDFTARSGLEPGDSIFFRIGLKNLGEFESPSFGLDLFGSDDE